MQRLLIFNVEGNSGKKVIFHRKKEREISVKFSNLKFNS